MGSRYDRSEDMSAEPKAEIESVIVKKLWDPAEFVQWWNENVRDKRHLTVAEAEEQTGITKQQVFKWRRRLKEPARMRRAS